MADFNYGVVYSPTWTTWNPPYSNTGAQAQFSDSDFFNDCFQALWNSGTDQNGNQYRDDIGVLGNHGFNLVRLYDWDPTRGWNAGSGTGDAHINFLNYAQEKGLQVIVPVSNYFLSDDQYAWNGNNPDSSYSFTSAPSGIQSALSQFISSVVVGNNIHPAVHSFSVGNEIDINTFVGQGTSDAVDPASRLARVIWWIVNLQYQISLAKYRYVLLTSPISNADQGNPSSGSPPLSYWFQAFLNGVTPNTNLPEGTVGGSGTFNATWAGIGSTIGQFNLWYYNSVNIYQTGSGLTNTLGQYDNWTPSQTNSIDWPGQQFDVPLLLTEIGVSRSSNDPAGQEAQFEAVTQDIATTIKTYLSVEKNSHLIGYCIYEFSDEVTVQENWGLYMVEPPEDPSGVVLYQEATGTTTVSYATWPSVDYPVDELFAVKNGDESLIGALKKIFGYKATLARR